MHFYLTPSLVILLQIEHALVLVLHEVKGAIGNKEQVGEGTTANDQNYYLKHDNPLYNSIKNKKYCHNKRKNTFDSFVALQLLIQEEGNNLSWLLVLSKNRKVTFAPQVKSCYTSTTSNHNTKSTTHTLLKSNTTSSYQYGTFYCMQ